MVSDFQFEPTFPAPTRPYTASSSPDLTSKLMPSRVASTTSLLHRNSPFRMLRTTSPCSIDILAVELEGDDLEEGGGGRIVRASDCSSGLRRKEPMRLTDTIAVMMELNTIANTPNGKPNRLNSEILGKIISAVRGMLPK